VVTSRWIDLAVEIEADARKCARVDLEDIEAADTLISFPDPPRSTNTRGGHFFEEGYGYARGRRVIIVGNRSHIFHRLSAVEFFPTWPEALRALTPRLRLAA
jgi:nucleoside 2-deoxyribosyltransferase